jgi:phosphate transport system substrate-binding protein
VPVDGKFVPNPYRSWHDIAATLPDRPIRVFGPAPGHGTRDALAELVMEPSCVATEAGRQLRADERASVCGAVRDDGVWVEVRELELVLGKLAHDPNAVGVLTYSYLEQFPTRLHAGTVESVAPTRATISAGTYPMSRPLFIYVKEPHLASTIGLADYAAEFLSLCAAGANGYLAESGLVPLSAADVARQRAIVARLQR